ncbi:MAG: FtsH protease activity modulator HflK [Burkholderiaceae bacterium]|nr:FtsH protease activity modulator HflK [Burkholderiaceae bacterium]
MLVSLLRKIGLMSSSNDFPPGNNQFKKNDGKRPGEGPPDLDQMWRDFTGRLARMFGKGGPGSMKPDARGTGIGVAIITCVLLLIWVLSGYFVVPEGQVAVVTTFGKMSRTVQPGINWRLPYPIQNHEVVNTSEAKTLDIGSRKVSPQTAMLTMDQNIVGVELSLQYKIKDATDWLYNNSEREETIKQAAETALREVVGRNTMDAVMFGGHEKLTADIAAAVQQMTDRYKLGVQIVGVTVQGVEPPEQVQQAFDDVDKAFHDAERYRNEGKAYAANVLPKAKSDAARLMQEAETYRTVIEVQAKSDTERFKQVLAEYQKAPAVTRDRMYLETMQQIFSNTTKVMVDSKNGNSLIYLPVDKLLAQSSNNGDGPKGSVTITTSSQSSDPAQPQAQPQPQSDVNQAVDSQRARDARSRDSRDVRESRERDAR